MTALAALWNYAGDPAEALTARMLNAQAIYGKYDALAATRTGAVAFGRRLWPLTPADAVDRGAVRAEGDATLLVADIRIDNRDELTKALGQPLSGLSDPQVAALVLKAWGADGVAQIVGPFAIVIWDARTESLTLARDALGERPLHYHCGKDFVAIASMPKGLHAHPAVDYAADLQMSADFLALLPETGNESFFQGIDRVPPGHIVTIDRTGVRHRRWWVPDLSPLHLRAKGDYEAALRFEIDRAVACRLPRTGGAIGTHLSGGLDSGIVAATAAQLLGSSQLLAFTAVPSRACPDPIGQFTDEGPIAALTAGHHANIEHIRVRAGATSPLDLMDRQFSLFERPVLNPSNAVWNEAINDAAQARGVEVMLTGQMGNFSVSPDGWPHLASLFRNGKWIELAKLLRDVRRTGATARSLVAATFGPWMPRALWSHIARMAGSDLPLEKYSALRQGALAAFDIDTRARARGLDLAYRPWGDGAAMRLWGLRRVDMGVYNKGTLAGWGIDLRDPTADRRLVEFALRVPERQYLLGGMPRSLARRAFSDRLPQAVLGERRRGLQGADWHLGFDAARTQIAAELDSFGRCSGATELVDVERLSDALTRWPDVERETADSVWLYRHAMLRGVAAGHFLRKVARTN